MLVIWRMVAVTGLSSTLQRANCTRSAWRRATSSKTGANARHGPHQGAQKSTTVKPPSVLERKVSSPIVATGTSMAGAAAGCWRSFRVRRPNHRCSFLRPRTEPGSKPSPSLRRGPAAAEQNPGAERDELCIFEEGPPAQRLREVHAETSAVLEGLAPSEGAERQRGPGDGDGECDHSSR